MTSDSPEHTPEKMKRLILCDFDGTISTQDIGYQMLNRFSRGDWDALDQAFSEGRIGSKEGYSQLSKIFKGKREDIVSYIREHSTIDPCFSLFYRYCRQSGIDVKIVSDGFDFTIATILKMQRLSEIPLYANTCKFLEGEEKEFLFPYSNGACGRCGTCKRYLVHQSRKEYDSILFVGNGNSDRCAAREADFAFAKGSLYPYCIEEGITCHYYNTFGDILADLRKEIRGVIFDLDGTLIDSYEAIYLGMKEAWQALGRTIFPFVDLSRHLKGDLFSTMTPFFSSEKIQKAIPIMRQKVEEVYLDKTQLLDGVHEVLDRLYKEGIVLGVASNKFGRFLRGTLHHLGVANYFTSMIGAGDVARNKPFPDMLHVALREMALPSRNVVFVGDTATDIETGRQAGMDVYALPTGFESRLELSMHKPKRMLKHLQELPSLIKNPIFSLGIRANRMG